MFLHKVSWTCGPSNTSVSVLPSHKSLFQVQALNTSKDVIDPQYCCLKLMVRSERTKIHFYLCRQLNWLYLSNFRWARSKWEWGQCWDLIYRWKGRTIHWCLCLFTEEVKGAFKVEVGLIWGHIHPCKGWHKNHSGWVGWGRGQCQRAASTKWCLP